MAAKRMTHGGGRLKRLSLSVILLALLVTSCASGGDGGAAGNSGNGGASPAATVKGGAASSNGKAKSAAVVLKESAKTVQGAVDSVVRPTEQLAVRQEKTMDVAASCKIGSSGQWPRRWGYGRRVVLQGNHVTVAENAVRTLRAEGWQIQVNSSTDDVVDVDAHQGDVVLHLVGEPTPPSLLVEGYGPCVQADGSTTSE